MGDGNILGMPLEFCLTSEGENLMKYLVSILLGIALTACSALAPAQPVVTPQVIIATVLVPVIPTNPPTAIQLVTPLVIRKTPSKVPHASPTPRIEATAISYDGGSVFTNLTRSADLFALRCLPDTITFKVSTPNVYVTIVEFYYRIEDRLSTSITTWENGGLMKSDGNGNFTIAFPALSVQPDLRSHKAWFDYQFVGINKYGDVVGRSKKIVQQVTYVIDCP
jgi:hypothetical protein